MLVDATEEKIKEAAAILRNGGLVAFPTETVYGLGAAAFNTEAIARIFEVKNRPQFDPLIVHINHMDSLRFITGEIPIKSRKLMERFWPGPLTVVLPKNEKVPEIVTSGLPSVAVRMPSHPVALQLIERAGTPVAAPSANPFGYLSPTTAEHVEEQLGDKVDIILDGGKCTVGVESTVIDFTTDDPTVLRPGGITIEEIEKLIGDVNRNAKNAVAKSPGQLESHYSPGTTLKLVDRMPPGGQKTGALFFRRPINTSEYAHVEVLSEKGDLKEAASRLFECLHRLDGANVEVIYAERVPEVGLGVAIMDRLRKAAAKF